jgi:hypothetical protein
MSNQPSGAVATTWRTIGVSVAGTSHQRAGVPCQDSCAWQILSDDRLVIAVADGAGSARHAEEGAQLATETAVSHLSRILCMERSIRRGLRGCACRHCPARGGDGGISARLRHHAHLPRRDQ